MPCFITNQTSITKPRFKDKNFKKTIIELSTKHNALLNMGPVRLQRLNAHDVCLTTYVCSVVQSGYRPSVMRGHTKVSIKPNSLCS